MSKIAIIGGSGIYNLDSVKIVNEYIPETPFGKTSGKILELDIEGHNFFFVARHGEGHSIAPSEINYRANIFALKELGVSNIVSVSAVGSLKDNHAPGNFVLVDQFIDWTKGIRKRTFFDEGIVGHVSCAYPVNADLRNRIASIIDTTSVEYANGGTYVCIEGPQFSSRAESDIYRSFHADVIGMTNVPEVYLAKEAGIAYATIAMVTDYDCWKEEHCTVEEIMKVMALNYNSAQKVIEKLVPSLVKDPVSFDPENKFAIVTRPELIDSDKKYIVDTLLS